MCDQVAALGALKRSGRRTRHGGSRVARVPDVCIPCQCVAELHRAVRVTELHRAWFEVLNHGRGESPVTITITFPAVLGRAVIMPRAIFATTNAPATVNASISIVKSARMRTSGA